MGGNGYRRPDSYGRDNRSHIGFEYISSRSSDIADIVTKGYNPEEEVKVFRQKFLDMKFCLPFEEALPLAARVLKSAFPYPEFAERLIENMEKK